MEFKLWGQILELNCYYIIILGYYIQPTWNYIFITFYNIVYIFRQCPASIYHNVRSLSAPQGAWAAMPPFHWSFGPQGGGSGRTYVRPDCVYALDHAD